jgi:hypothetical protein
MTSTRILLNGHPGHRICHTWELCQGDPLSLLLFVITMDMLNALFFIADNQNLLTPLHPIVIRHRLSLYADDLVIFVSPVE